MYGYYLREVCNFDGALTLVENQGQTFYDQIKHCAMYLFLIWYKLLCRPRSNDRRAEQSFVDVKSANPFLNQLTMAALLHEMGKVYLDCR